MAKAIRIQCPPQEHYAEQTTEKSSVLFCIVSLSASTTLLFKINLTTNPMKRSKYLQYIKLSSYPTTVMFDIMVVVVFCAKKKNFF